MEIKFYLLQGRKIDCLMECAKNWIEVNFFKWFWYWFLSYMYRITINGKIITKDKSIEEE